MVENGDFQEAGISELLQAPGRLPNNYGTRNLADNLSDLRAQVAANHKGAQLMHDLVRRLFTFAWLKSDSSHLSYCLGVRVLVTGGDCLHDAYSRLCGTSCS